MRGEAIGETEAKQSTTRTSTKADNYGPHGSIICNINDCYNGFYYAKLWLFRTLLHNNSFATLMVLVGLGMPYYDNHDDGTANNAAVVVVVVVTK